MIFHFWSPILFLLPSTYIHANDDSSKDCDLKETNKTLSLCGRDCFIKYEVERLRDPRSGGRSCSAVANSKKFLPDWQSKSGYVYRKPCFSESCKASYCGKGRPQTVPTAVSSLCPSGVNCLPGFTVVGSGFDVWTGNLEKPIVAYSFKSYITYSGKRVPDQHQVTPDHHIDVDVKTDTFESVDEYRRNFASSIGIRGFLRGIPLGGSFQISNKYSRYYKISSKLLRSVKKVSLWKTALTKVDFDLMTSNFKTAVMSLPSEYSYGSYLYFIEAFGTHIVTRANFGGMYVMESSVCSVLYKNRHKTKFGIMAALGLTKMEEGSAKTSLVVAQDEGEKQLIKQLSIKVYGGDPIELCCASKACTWDNWYKGVDDDPYYINYKVLPISHVIRSARYFKQADNLDRAVNEYLEQKTATMPELGSFKCQSVYKKRRGEKHKGNLG